LFQIDLAMKPELSGDEAHARTLEHLRDFAKNGPSAREVEKSKNRIESAFLRALIDADGKAEQIGHFETTANDAGFVLTVLERLRAVSPDGVRAAVAEFLNPQACTTVRVLPEG
jgi:predicted Zn-dependent peptidase